MYLITQLCALIGTLAQNGIISKIYLLLMLYGCNVLGF